jgi:hypothetical protein
MAGTALAGVSRRYHGHPILTRGFVSDATPDSTLREHDERALRLTSSALELIRKYQDILPIFTTCCPNRSFPFDPIRPPSANRAGRCAARGGAS